MKITFDALVLRVLNFLMVKILIAKSWNRIFVGNKGFRIFQML